MDYLRASRKAVIVAGKHQDLQWTTPFYGNVASCQWEWSDANIIDQQSCAVKHHFEVTVTGADSLWAKRPSCASDSRLAADGYFSRPIAPEQSIPIPALEIA